MELRGGIQEVPHRHVHDRIGVVVEKAERLIHPGRVAGRVHTPAAQGEPMLPKAVDVAVVHVEDRVPRRLVGIADPASVADIIVDDVVRAGLELPMLRAEMDEP